MTAQQAEPWIWVGLGISILAGVRIISYQLHQAAVLVGENPSTDVRDDTIPEDRKAKQPEDDIPLATLQTLSSCPTPEIRDAACKIICDRFLRSPSSQAYLNRLQSSNNHSENEQARDIFSMIAHYRIFMDYDSSSSLRGVATEEQGLFLPVTMVQEGDVTEVGDAEESPEEAALRRRRRREAIVVASEDEEALVLQPGGVAWESANREDIQLLNSLEERRSGDGSILDNPRRDESTAATESVVDLRQLEGLEVEETGISGLVVIRPAETE